MKSKEIKEKINNGFIRARVMFEIIGKPKDHVEKTLKAYIENIKSKTSIIVLQEEYEDAQEAGDGLFSVVSEVEMLVENIEQLTWLAINFSPASIEMLEPNELYLNQKQIDNWVNDFLSRLHEVGTIQKNLNAQVQALTKNFNAMTRNAILLSLQEPRELDFISKKIGMPDEYTKKFLEALIKEKRVLQEKNKYVLRK